MLGNSWTTVQPTVSQEKRNSVELVVVFLATKIY
jgi:hypothetical protein